MLAPVASCNNCIASAIGLGGAFLIGATPLDATTPIRLVFHGNTTGAHVLTDVATGKVVQRVATAEVTVTAVLLKTTVWHFAPAGISHAGISMTKQGPSLGRLATDRPAAWALQFEPPVLISDGLRSTRNEMPHGCDRFHALSRDGSVIMGAGQVQCAQDSLSRVDACRRARHDTQKAVCTTAAPQDAYYVLWLRINILNITFVEKSHSKMGF